MKTNANKCLAIATTLAGLMISAAASAQNSLGDNMLNGNNPQGQAYPQQTQPGAMQAPSGNPGSYGQPQYPGGAYGQGIGQGGSGSGYGSSGSYGSGGGYGAGGANPNPNYGGGGYGPSPQYPSGGPGGYGPNSQNPNIEGGGYGPGPNPAYVPGQNPGYGPNIPGGQAGGGNELQDFGVRATKQLHSGPFHGPTPTSIPGGRVITTQQLSTMAQQNRGNVLIFDVLGGPAKLPNAMPAVLAAQPGSFNDNIQQQFSQYLKQASNNDVNKALVFYCQSVQCWMSYNAALRAINLGYRNVFWYRGGIEAWQRSGLQTASAQAQGWQR